MKRKRLTKKDLPILFLAVILLAGIAFSGWKLYGIFSDYRRSQEIYEAAASQYTARREAEYDIAAKTAPASESDAPEDEKSCGFLRIDQVCGFSVDFENLWRTNPDIVAWISAPDTVIDYPVLLGEDNDTYIHTTWEGSYAASGSIFINSRMRGDLSDPVTIVYGHNMKSGAMFHSLKGYMQQSYYDEHPYIWYVTPDEYYILYVIAGYQADTSDAAYDDKTSEEVRQFIEEARGKSCFSATWIVDGHDADEIAKTAKHAVVLSTCSTASENARYVIVAVPLLAK